MDEAATKEELRPVKKQLVSHQNNGGSISSDSNSRTNSNFPARICLGMTRLPFSRIHSPLSIDA